MTAGLFPFHCVLKRVYICAAKKERKKEKEKKEKKKKREEYRRGGEDHKSTFKHKASYIVLNGVNSGVTHEQSNDYTESRCMHRHGVCVLNYTWNPTQGY